ncbi:MAG: sugar phosphate isomerase/epimerase [Capsulimonadales bacterium]|nr:sugar phosphate isomerase/epimerase [Capsulimonadales bacterium]
MQLGIQTIIFGKRTGEDLPGVLRDIKAAGYDGVEFGMGSRTPEEVLTLFRSENLAVCGYHAGYNTFTDPEETKKQGKHLAAVGGKYLMCSGIEGWQKADRDAYLRSAENFNRAGAALREEGVHFCYHNHNWEFFPLADGGNGMDLLIAHTDPELVKLCPDVYWLACGGNDPAAWIRQNAARCVYFHFKDGTFDAATQQPTTFTELGRGAVDLVGAIAAVRELNPEWVVTEQDRTEGDPAESARISAEYARTTLGI